MNAPTLIVGLGGTGSKIALKVSKLASEEQMQRIGFAVFDTDVNELSAIKRDNPFVHTIQTSTKLSVGEYLDIDHHARDSWFPVNAILNSKTLTEGAGQVRAVSRLAFETALRAGKLEELHKAIENLYKLEGNEYEQALRVIIVSSLAGGTGSGLILPVALYIKNYLKTHFRQSANITRGFFILPEVFEEVIKGQAERNNLKRNAYACLRELDAFLMKADSTLPEKYMNTVKMEFPSVSSKGYEEYLVRPFDFCFLFDAQNASGAKMDSFDDYMTHAASCIYSMSIGPMNKRSNSSEDNTIGKLIAEKGRNRYAGAGCSILSYPVEDVKQYLSLSWAKNCISQQWLAFDDEIKKKREAEKRKKELGVRTAEPKISKEYMGSVEQKANMKNAFALAVLNSTKKYDETGFTPIGDKWDIYIDELKQQVEREFSYDELDFSKNKAKKAIQAINPGGDQSDWNKYITAYNSLELYLKEIKKYRDDNASTIAYSIYRSDEGTITAQNDNPTRLENYMRDDEGNFIHPSAVRYFLYKTYDAIVKECRNVETDVREIEEFFENFREKTFDDTSTEGVIEDETMLSKTRKLTSVEAFQAKVFHKLSQGQEEVIDKYRIFLSKCEEYRGCSIYYEVLKEGVSYVEDLCKAFELFYRYLEGRIPGISTQISKLEKKYTYSSGKATKYVCASEKCLHALEAEMPYMGGSITVDSGLAERLYNGVHTYAMANNKPTEENFFRDLFDNELIGYFKESLMSIYGEKVDKDIIEAIECEAVYQAGLKDDTEIEKYVENIFNEAKVLAAPFIEKPLGEERDPLNSCTYNKELDPKDESPKSRLIDRELRNYGGEPDEDIPKNLIMFYNSFYGLRANELSKFAPPLEAQTDNHSGGEYFKAYYDAVGKIYPNQSKSKAITPHIDKWWHTLLMLPDLDDDNQEKQENRICAAFFWGLLANKISYLTDEDNNQKEIYQLMLDSLDMKTAEKRLVVSNGTPCDRLYEVLDALYIYPELVEKIMKRIEDECNDEVNENLNIEESLLYKSTEEFVIPEYRLNDSNCRSIFDLPMLLKKSTISDLYDEEKVLRVLRVEIDECKKTIRRYCGSKDFPKIAGSFIKKQFDRFLEDMKIESATWANLYSDYLFSRVCDIVAVAEEELGCKKEAAEINKKKTALVNRS